LDQIKINVSLLIIISNKDTDDEYRLVNLEKKHENNLKKEKKIPMVMIIKSMMSKIIYVLQLTNLITSEIEARQDVQLFIRIRFIIIKNPC